MTNPESAETFRISGLFVMVSLSNCCMDALDRCYHHDLHTEGTIQKH
jgi:hypothetical protein